MEIIALVHARVELRQSLSIPQCSTSADLGTSSRDRPGPLLFDPTALACITGERSHVR